MVRLLLLALVTEEVAEGPVIVVVVVVIVVVGAVRVVDMMVAVGVEVMVLVVARTVVIVNIGIMVLIVSVLHLWLLFHRMMVLAVTLLHPWGMEWKQFPRLQAMLAVPLLMVVLQGVMMVVGVVEVVDMMVVVLLDARSLVMEMHLLKKSSIATRIVMKLVIMQEYTSLIYLRM